MKSWQEMLAQEILADVKLLHDFVGPQLRQVMLGSVLGLGAVMASWIAISCFGSPAAGGFTLLVIFFGGLGVLAKKTHKKNGGDMTPWAKEAAGAFLGLTINTLIIEGVREYASSSGRGFAWAIQGVATIDMALLICAYLFCMLIRKEGHDG